MEKAINFGSQNNLMGIISEPDSGYVDDNLPIILILNAGFIHHVGPFRMSVDISRQLSKEGFRVFRFDLSGIGDSSRIVNDALKFKERNLADVGEAINYLNDKYSSSKYVLLGLCTGADLAHRAAVTYPETIGTILMDGYAYPTAKYYLLRYNPLYFWKRLVSIAKDNTRWKNQIALLKEKTPGTSPKGVDAYYWELPEKNLYLKDMQNMKRAGKKHFYLFTSGVKYYNYENQFKDSFRGCDFLENVEIRYFAESDHLFTLADHQKALFESIKGWLKKSFSLLP